MVSAPTAGPRTDFGAFGGSDPAMADSLELILRVRAAQGDDARELAMLAGWLRSELLDLHVRGVDRLPAEAAPGGAASSADTADLLLVQLAPKAFQAVVARVNAWAAESEHMVEISSGGHTVTLGSPTRQQPEDDNIDGSLVSGTDASPVRPEGEIEAVIEAAASVVPKRDSPALESGGALTLRPHESLQLIQLSHRPSGDLAKRNRLADACLLVTGSINVAALPREESRSTATFALVSSLLGAGFAALVSIGILAIIDHYHRLSVSASYPIHRVYYKILRYFIRITPTPGNPHMLLVYTVYLAVLPVLFAAVFMYLKPGTTQLIVAALACVIFMAAPFIIVITSIRDGTTNCGSWNYPEPNSGAQCFNALEVAFRIAFGVGVVGLAAPIVYLIRGRQDGHKNGLLIGVLILCASVVTGVFSSAGNVTRRQAKGNRYIGRNQKASGAIGKYLLPNEQQIIAIRQHPVVLIGPSVLALAGAVIAGVLTATVLKGSETFLIVVWIVCLMLIVRMIWRAIDWSAAFFVVTSERLLLFSGALTKKISMLPLVRVTDMSIRRSYAGRLLGFGEFVFESADTDQPLRSIDYIPYAAQIYLEICGLLFPGSGYDQGSADESYSIGG